MKSIKLIILICTLGFAAGSCSMFKPKYGCPSDGRNMGAEKFISGEVPKKTKKFRG